MFRAVLQVSHRDAWWPIFRWPPRGYGSTRIGRSPPDSWNRSSLSAKTTLGLVSYLRSQSRKRYGSIRAPSSHELPPRSQLPAWHSSFEHGSPSEQEFESSGVYLQPVAGTHRSSVHGLWSLQSTLAVPHSPFTHASPVQASPSSALVHAFVSSFRKVHPAVGLQTSSVHGLPSSQ